MNFDKFLDKIHADDTINEQFISVLYNLNKDYFFEEILEEIDKEKAKKLDEDPTTFGGWNFSTYKYEYVTLKKEFCSKLETMSFSETAQLMHIASSQSKTEELSKKIKSIKGWIIFLVVLYIIPIVMLLV